MSPQLTTLLLLALALSMDSFAAAMSKGAVACPSPSTGGALLIGAAFGGAQAVMPMVGWALGSPSLCFCAKSTTG